MPRQIIPHDQWERFFDELSREYGARMASLEMVPEGARPQLVSFDQPLGGISAADAGGRATITIRLGAEPSALTIETPLRVATQPFERGGGQIVEIEAADTPLTRLYLSRSREQSTGRGEIYGGAEPHERAIGQAPAASRNRGVNRAGADFDTGAGAADAESNGVPLGTGLGGVRGVGGGSLGDRDLSGRQPGERDELEAIAGADDTTVGPGSDVAGTGAVSVSGADRTTKTGFGLGGDVDVADLGANAGIIDTTRDPIGGDGDETEGLDDSDDMVEGEVGAQAERDLTELLGAHTHDRFDPEDAALQQRLSELIEEDDDEEDESGLSHR